jgi:hypothetical protein
VKIEKQIETWVDVEVDITIEDIIAAINELPRDDDFHVKRGITSCWHYLKAIPDPVISAMNEVSKKTIFEALTKEIQRFAPTVTGES